MQHPPKKQFKHKSRQLPAILMAAVLVLAAGLVMLLPAIKERFPARTLEYELKQDTVRTIGERDRAQIERVIIWPDGVNSYTLHMRGDRLMLERNGGLEAIDETYQAQILDTLTDISVQNTVAEDWTDLQDELGAMGLREPACKAEVHYANGLSETMEVGVMAHGSAEYYFRWSGAPGIYLCHSGVAETLSMQQNLLLPFQQITISTPLVEKLTVENAAGKCVLAFENGAAKELSVPHRYPLDGETAQNLLTALGSFRLGAYEAPLTDENRAAYGFDAPLCTLEIGQRGGMINAINEEGSLIVQEQPAQNFVLTIGREEGEYFYTCAYQGKVYLISRFLAEVFVQADWQKMITRRPAAMENSLLSDAVFETGDRTLEIHVERTESVLENNQLELDAEGNPVFRTTVTFNGQEVPQEKLDVLMERLNAFAVEGVIPSNTVPEKEPRWRITLVAADGEIRVLEGYRLDVFSDAVALNGTMCHYVYDEAIDVLLAAIE